MAAISLLSITGIVPNEENIFSTRPVPVATRPKANRFKSFKVVDIAAQVLNRKEAKRTEKSIETF
jgi:hypothetical protein